MPEIASIGQAATQAPQSVHCRGSVMTACLRCFSVSRVMILSGQAATQRPQPEQRSMVMVGITGSGIKQFLLFPFFHHQLLFADRVVAGAGGDHSKLRLLAGTSTADAEFVERVVLLLFF